MYYWKRIYTENVDKYFIQKVKRILNQISSYHNIPPLDFCIEDEDFLISVCFMYNIIDKSLEDIIKDFLLKDYPHTVNYISKIVAIKRIKEVLEENNIDPEKRKILEEFIYKNGYAKK